MIRTKYNFSNMFKLFIFLLIFCALQCEGSRMLEIEKSLKYIRPQTEDSVQVDAVLGLIKRLLPLDFSKFEVVVNSNLLENGKEVFQVESLENGIIQLTGTTGVAAATGLNYYLKYYCNAHLGWQVSQLNLPKILPPVNISETLNDRFRYYQNVCTTSYSFVWWSWFKWETHIDWMVMNSFNLILAFNGQEAIWKRVYQQFGLTNEEIDAHFTGPAFLSWLRMGNVLNFGGPLSDNWHSRSLELQKLIVNRLRSFGVITVLPGFAGHLPRAFKRLYPDTKMVQMTGWNHFSDPKYIPYFLEPTESLFNKIGRAFIKEQITEFGTDHVYNCDSFNEVDPSSTDLGYLGNVSKATYSAMTDEDPKAIWLLQGWLFHYGSFWKDINRVKALLTSVPLGKMIILDLQSEQFPQYERLDNYFGQPFIWCMLHNFGGTLGMFGSSDTINEEPIKTRNSKGSTMIGIGLTPEGINQNYVNYDLMSENAYRKESTNLTLWFGNYSIRRYGKENSDAVKTWTTLQDSVYNFKLATKMRGQYAVTRTPSLRIDTWSWYEASTLFAAWESLIKASSDPDIKNSPGYLHDLVDLTRQWLQVNGDIIYSEIQKNYNYKSYFELSKNVKIFLDLLNDMEELLATNNAFLLGCWIQSARSVGTNIKEKDQYEYNAKNQITLWGPEGQIMNYAIKQWSGVVSDFLRPRWELFFDYMNSSIVENFNFNQSYIKNKMFQEVEQPFTLNKTVFPCETKGDTMDVAMKIFKKWSKHYNYGLNN